MCGRYNLIATPEQLLAHFNLQRLPRYQASFNIVPAQKVLAVVELEDKTLKAVNLYWGLVPSWAKGRKISAHLINARAETVQARQHFSRKLKWDPSDFSSEKFAGDYCLRLPTSVLYPPRHTTSLRYAVRHWLPH